VYGFCSFHTRSRDKIRPSQLIGGDAEDEKDDLLRAVIDPSLGIDRISLSPTPHPHAPRLNVGNGAKTFFVWPHFHPTPSEHIINNI
jgi:hypothetical protein